VSDRERVMKELSWIINNFPKQKDPKDVADKMCNAINTYCSDALSLLKEQEPRVMTVEEVRDCVDYVWSEIFTPMKGRRCLIYCPIGQNQGYSETADLDEDSGQSWTRQWDNYGKTWRCWTARPTEEQMRDTPLEEGNEKPV